MKRKSVLLILFVISLLMLNGCATNRGILDVRLTLPENSVSDLNIKIVRVTDQRRFEIAPNKPSIPSLKGGEIDDKSITKRAIARKRNSFGKALGDILLPEGRTVEDLVREAVVLSFRESGYRVINEEDPMFSSAIPIEVDIDEFWAWLTPGFSAVKLEFKSALKLKGNVVSFQDGEEVRSYVLLHSQAAGTRAWSNTINKGIENLVQKIKERLRNTQDSTSN